MLTDHDLQKAFRLIHCLHPDRAVAQCVLQDAYDRIPLIEKLQGRRPESPRPFKTVIPEDNLLQFAVYLASEIWERDQEANSPRKEPRYRPTRDDLLVRYIKTLIWKSMDRRSCYTAVGLGCLLYTYQPHEISSLTEEHFDSDNIRRVKGWITEQVKARFQRVKGFQGQNGHIEFEVPSNWQKALIQRSLSGLAPWAPCDATTQTPSISILGTFFYKESKKTEWERIHVLADPKCGGLSRLVQEYNATYRKGNDMRLDDPGSKLRSPKFDDDLDGSSDDGGDGGPSDPGDRFDPPDLTHNEISSLKHSFERNQQRRKSYRLSTLYVYVDGEETATLTHDTYLNSFTISNTASCIEVFGEDAEGVLLLGVFPLNFAGHPTDSAERKLQITHEGGQVIEIIIAPVSDHHSDNAESLVWIEYSEPAPRITTVTNHVPQGSSTAFRPEGRPASGINIFIDDDPPITGARIKVIGVGGGGGNAVNRMIEAGIEGIEFLVANTDLQALKRSRTPYRIQLGGKLTKGLGAGANPDIGRNAALEDTEKIIEALEGADMVFITTGLGGGTGTGAASIIASLATELNALTVAVVTKPFHFEGKRRMAQADQGLRELRECADAVITIPNERLLYAADPKMSLTDSFKMADDVLRQAVQGISDLITIPGLINLDFADVKAIMSGMGLALMGAGRASGENRAVEATQQAISSPLLEEATIQGAKCVLINITGGSDLTLHEINEAASIIRESADDDANIIFGAVIDESLRDEMNITVIATGFDKENADAGTTARAATAARPPSRNQYAPDLASRPVAPTRSDDLDVPTFIRRKKSE